MVVTAALALTVGGGHARAAAVCLPPSPLPVAPSAEAQSVSFTAPITATASYSAILWREPCATNAAVSTLYLRVSPPPSDSVRLGTLFVVQNGLQSNAYIYQASGDIPRSPFNALIASATTFLIESPPELTGKTAFDPNLPTTLVISLGPSASLPPYGAAGAQDASPPSIPESLTSTVMSSNAINLTWAAATDTGGSGLAGYTVERCAGVACTRFGQIGTVTTGMLTDVGLNASTAYTYRVRAYDSAGNYSAYSRSSSTMTLGAGVATMAVATEFYHPLFDHYFITADAAETASLMAGNLSPWIATGNTFWVWTAAQRDMTNVCRFFSATFAPKSGHFYSNDPRECEALQAAGVWTLENSAAFYVMNPTAGLCSIGTTPLYRLYNDGQGGAPNHRYTIDPTIRRSMIDAFWIGEGNGADAVFACVPDDGSVGYQQTASLLGGTWSFSLTRNGVESSDTFAFTSVRAKVESWQPWAADGTNQHGWSISALYSTTLRNFALSSPINPAGVTTFPQDYFEFSYTGENTLAGCSYYRSSFNSSLGSCSPFTGWRTPAP